MKKLLRVSAALARIGTRHVLVSAEITEAEHFLDLAVPNDRKLWGIEVPKLLRGLDPQASDANIKSAVTYAIKQNLPRLIKEHGARINVKPKDIEGFFRDRMDEIREMFDTAQGKR